MVPILTAKGDSDWYLRYHSPQNPPRTDGGTWFWKVPWYLFIRQWFWLHSVQNRGNEWVASEKLGMYVWPSPKVSQMVVLTDGG